MIRLNLQLFALKKNMVYINDGAGSNKKEEETEKQTSNTLNTNTSIVDYLKSQGAASDYASREALAASLGMSGYQGTAEQNTQLLNALKNGTTPSVSVTPSAQTSNTNVAGAAQTAISGVDQATIDKMNAGFNASANLTSAQQMANQYLSELQQLSGKKDIVDQATWDIINSNFQASDKVTGAQQEADKYLGALKDLSGKTDLISQDTWNAINNPFQVSDAYQEAMKYTNSLLEQLSTGRTSYTDQINDMMGQIQNRDKFAYDVDADPLFQQALASAMGSGKTAMQDTMGQAAALTGGYGSSYGTTAANQAYNSFIQDAYNNLPQYYQLALEAYEMEGQEMYDQLAMLNSADAQEYERMYNSWNANFNNTMQMYQNEYSAWQDSVQNAYNSANMQLQEHGQLYDQAYNTYSAVQNSAQQAYQNEYNAWLDSIQNAFNSANMQLQEHSQLYEQAYNTYSATQENANTLYAQEYQKWADEVANAFSYAGMLNADYWNTEEFNESVRQYNESLAQNQAQFEQEMAYKNAALAQDNAQFYASLASKGSGSDSGLSEATETQNKKALEAYNTGGMDALNQYLNSLQSSVDKDAIADYVGNYGTYDTAENPLPIEQRTFTVANDGNRNWFGGVDNNVVVTDQYGNEFKLSELKEIDKELALELSKLGVGESYTR